MGLQLLRTFIDISDHTQLVEEELQPHSPMNKQIISRICAIAMCIFSILWAIFTSCAHFSCSKTTATNKIAHVHFAKRKKEITFDLKDEFDDHGNVNFKRRFIYFGSQTHHSTLGDGPLSDQQVKDKLRGSQKKLASARKFAALQRKALDCENVDVDQMSIEEAVKHLKELRKLRKLLKLPIFSYYRRGHVHEDIDGVGECMEIARNRIKVLLAHDFLSRSSIQSLDHGYVEAKSKEVKDCPKISRALEEGVVSQLP